MSEREIILASASPRRAELLKQIGLTFKIIPSRASEEFKAGISPQKLVKELAQTKANEVARTMGYQTMGPTYVIGADTVVVLDDKILGKPNDREEAALMLEMLSGKEHSVFTGLAIVELPSNKSIVDFVETKVVFRHLNHDDIQRYLATGEPMDKAGAYGIQGRGAVLVEKIDGCYFNVVGLPLSKLVDMFRDLGVIL